MERAATALAAGDDGAEAAYGDALERWLALGGADLDERADAAVGELGLRRDARHAHGGALGRPGGASEPRLAAAEPLRRLPARRADERPRPRRPRAPRALRLAPARRRGARQPRPRVPGAHGHPRRRARPRAAPGERLRRRLRRVPRGARDQAAPRARGIRGVRRHAGIARGARAHAADVDGEGRAQRAPQGDGQRQARPQVPRGVDRAAGREGEADRATHRAPAGGRRTAPRVGAAHGDRGGAARGQRRSRGSTVRSCDAARSRSARSRCRSSGPIGSRSPGANGSGKSTLLAALLGRIPLDAGSARLGPGVVVGEVDQARARFLGERPVLEAFGAEVPDMLHARRPHPARQVRAAWPTTSSAPP